MSGAPTEPEHSIDLGAIEHAGIPAPETHAPEPRTRRVPNTVLAYLAVTAALAAAVVTFVKWAPFERTAAEEIVASFLEAVHEGDIPGALAHTDEPDLTGDFLVPEALDSRWSVVTVAQVEYFDEPRGVGADVYAEIEAYEGTRIGYRFRVRLDDEPVIQNGVAESEAYSQFGMIGLNGAEAPVEVDTYRVRLLPGLYELYPDLPSTMALIDGDTEVLVLGSGFARLGSDRVETSLPIGWPVVTAEGEAVIEAALEARLDACAQDPLGDGCPFAFPEDPDRQVAVAPGGGWEITAYPQAAAIEWSYEPSLGFTLTTLVPGAAQVPVVITEDGRERETVVSCPLWVDNLYARLDFDGGVDIDAEGEEHCRSLIEV